MNSTTFVVGIVCLLLLFLLLCIIDRREHNQKVNNVKYIPKYRYDENGEDEDEDEEEDEEEVERFYYIDCEDVPGNWDDTFNIIVDKKTRVQYIEINGDDGLTVLIDGDGKPILYTGNFDEECREDEEDENEEGERFYYIDSEDVPGNWDDTFNIIVDKKTRVQYLDFDSCGLTALIGPDGKPILYTGNFDE